MGFIKPAWKSRKKDKALKAVAALSDQAMLLRVVKEAPIEEVRYSAVLKLTDQNVLANLAIDSDIFTRIGYAAVNMLIDQSALEYVMEHATLNPLMRVATIKRIQNKEVIAHYAMNDEFKGVRDAAREMLNGPLQL